MSKIDPTVRRETRFIALSVLAGSLLIQGICLLAGWWDYTVLLGNLLGAVTAVGNFLLMGLMIQKALQQDEKTATNTVRISQGLRLLLQGLLLVLGAIFFNIWATAIPLLVPRAAITLRQWVTKQPVTAVPHNRDTDDDDDDDDLGGDTE